MFRDILRFKLSFLLAVLWIYSNHCICMCGSTHEDVLEVDRIDSHQWRSKCETITAPFCQHIEYDQTVFPNTLHHQTQREAALVIQQYTPALKNKCSPDTQFFLCSLYIPICTLMPEPILPCKSLCLSVRNNCEQMLKNYSLPWPKDLDCDKFPDDSKTQLCVSKNNTIVGNAGSKGNQYGNSGNNNGDIYFGSSNSGSDTSERVNFECPDYLRVPTGYDDSVKVRHPVNNCALPCDDMFFDKDELHLSRLWVGTWSTVGAVSCLFTVLTFALNTSRFRYPERPIIFLSVCYLAVSLVYVLGFVSGDKIACRRPFPPPPDKQWVKPSTIVQGIRGELCTIMFICLYFFTMASSLWWVILALTWFLAAGLKWSHEAIEANSQYFHLAAWAIPAIKTISILALGKIEGDVLTGVCYTGLWDPDVSGTFILAPLLVYLVFGTIFLMLGFVSLFHIRTAMKRDGTKTDKLEKLMLRIGIFSLLYTLPAATVIACLIYEQMNFDNWMVTWHRHICQESLIRCPPFDDPDEKPNFYIFMLKYFSSLIVGVSSCVWIASRKTLASWKELFYRILGKPGQTYV